MTDAPALTAIVDSHAHWWDPSNPWMLMIDPDAAEEINFGDVSRMGVEPYLPSTYHQDIDDLPVTKVVWVMATMDAAGNNAEVAWVRAAAAGDSLLAAVVGSVDASLDDAARAASLAVQSEAPEFRGVRVITELDYDSYRSDDYMRMLAEGGWSFDHMGTYRTLAQAAALADRHPDVPWILEHCAWPMHPEDPDYMAGWRDGIRAIAAVPTISCKLSGVAMSTHSFDLDTQRPVLEFCLEQFGIDRCMFGSNFPVDRRMGTYRDLLTMYERFAAPLSADERDALFRGTAERVYRI